MPITYKQPDPDWHVKFEPAPKIQYGKNLLDKTDTPSAQGNEESSDSSPDMDD